MHLALFIRTSDANLMTYRAFVGYNDEVSDSYEVMMHCVLDMKGQRFTFTIESDLIKPLKAQAQTERRSVGSLLNWLIAQHLKETQGVAIEPSIQHGGDRRSKNAGGENND